MKAGPAALGALLCLALVRADAAPPPARVVIDRLFFSQDERNALERPRRTEAPAPVVPMATIPDPPPGRAIALDAAGTPRPAQPQPKSVEIPAPKVTGYVKRSSGNNTVWVNQQPHYKHAD